MELLIQLHIDFFLEDETYALVFAQSFIIVHSITAQGSQFVLANIFEKWLQAVFKTAAVLIWYADFVKKHFRLTHH